MWGCEQAEVFGEYNSGVEDRLKVCHSTQKRPHPGNKVGANVIVN